MLQYLQHDCTRANPEGVQSPSAILERRGSRLDEPRGSPIACNGGYGEWRATIYPKGGRSPVACLLSSGGRASLPLS